LRVLRHADEYDGGFDIQTCGIRYYTVFDRELWRTYPYSNEGKPFKHVELC
jgi:hypothetical protein